MSATTVLASMDRSARVERLRAAIGRTGADGLLVTKLVNLRWLTGFTGSAGVLLVAGRKLVLVTDGRYRDQVAHEVGDAGVDLDVVIAADAAPAMAAAAERLELHQVGVESDHITWSMVRQVGGEWFPDTEIVATSGLIESLRAIKEPGEVARIEAAAGVADAALGEVVAMLATGATEIEVASALESTMRRLGADGPAFDTIVASGSNSAIPHHHPTTRPIERGDLVVIDMGATIDGYRSDMTRTFVVGPPTDAQQRLLDVVGAAQAAGVAAVAAGVASREVDATARSVIVEAGWAAEFTHPTGHGLGLEIHEPLRLAATSDATLAAGHVVTVEPGVYLLGAGGVRIEDTVEVTDTGSRLLTRSSLPQVVG